MSALPHPGTFLPHEGTAILLDEVVRVDAEHACCRVHIGPSTRFLRAGTVPATAAIEYMAQTMGVYTGFHARRKGGEVKPGFLLSVRGMHLHTDAFHLGDTLQVHAKLVWGGEEAIGIFACQVERNGELVASGRLNAYQGALPDDV